MRVWGGRGCPLQGRRHCPQLEPCACFAMRRHAVLCSQGRAALIADAALCCAFACRRCRAMLRCAVPCCAEDHWVR